MSNKSLVLPHNSEGSQQVKAVPTEENNKDEQINDEAAGRDDLIENVANNNQISSTRKYISFCW